MIDQTPGAWKAIDKDDEFIVSDADGNVIARLPVYDELTEHHAALIASAPDLLAENKRLRKALLQMCKDYCAETRGSYEHAKELMRKYIREQEQYALEGSE